MIFSLPKVNLYYQNIVEALAFYPPLEGVALLPVDSDTFIPCHPAESARINIGVYVPGNGQITATCLNPAFEWDLIIVPSSWLEHQLKIRGITNVITVVPGCKLPDGKFFDYISYGRFIVASSGRISLLQGHDLIVAAMRRFMAAHHDCWFACNWELTLHDMDTLRLSQYCDLEGCVPWDRTGFLNNNGIDVARVVALTPDAPPWDLVRAADVYLMPARAMGATDDVPSAFMAVNKPVITFTPLDGVPHLAPDGTTVWFEPSVSIIVERLETAYALWRKDQLRTPATVPRTWAVAAEEVYSAVIGCCVHQFPLTAFTWNKRGAVLVELSLFDLALESYHHAQTLEPLNPETFNCIGNLMDTQERYEEALLYFDKALGIDNRFTAALFNKATTLKRMQRLDEAIDVYQAALQSDPILVIGWLNLAIAYALNSQEHKAEDCFRTTLELDSHNTDALFLWGNQLLGQREPEKAMNCYQQVLALDPDHYLACNSMGIAYLTLMEAEQAYSILQRALEINPDMTSAMTNIGTACRDLGRLDEAVFWYEHALHIEPDDADTHWNYALALLHQGNYAKGWREYAWRFQKSDRIIIPSSNIPIWNGEDLEGKRILVQAEQGYGDTIQFIRYVSILAARGAYVIMECQDENISSAVDLLAGIGESITWHDPHPQADYKIPLLSLPLVLNSTVETIPLANGYLVPSSANIAHWRTFLDAYVKPGNVRVGFVWDGRKTFRNDKRSVPLDVLKPLFDVEGITFVSLQIGEQAQQLEQFSVPGNIVTAVSGHLTSFADTAALIAGLDLVICVDTSVAHLAGAVGCPTWIMLKVGPDWRWLEKRNDSPWYLAARLYRQKRDGEWDSVVQQIQMDLKKFTFDGKFSQVFDN